MTQAEPQTSLSKLIADVMTMCRVTIEKKNREVRNHFLAEDESGKRIMIQTNWSSPDERDLMLKAVREQFQKLGVVRFVHVSEAWLSANVKLGRASQDPERVDGLTISGVDSETGEKYAAAYYVEQLPGKKRKIGKTLEETFGEGIKYKSPIFAIFDKPKPAPFPFMQKYKM